MAPFSSVYCTGSTESQFATRMKTNSVTASGSTNGAIFMPIAAFDLAARLNRDRFPEQLHAAWHTVDVTLARKKNASDHDHRGDRGRQHRVGVDGESEPVRLGVADLDAGFAARIVSVIAVPLRSRHRHRTRSFFIGSAVEITSTTWNRAMPNTTPSPCGRKMNAIVAR